MYRDGSFLTSFSMKKSCEKFNTPVTGGNVSFYNESNLGAVYPTPVIGMVGLLEDSSKHMDVSFKNSGDMIVAIGSINGELGGSEYLKLCHGVIEGPIPEINLEIESSLHKICLELISKGLINSAHDLSDGGLAVNIAESIAYSKENIGAKLNLVRKLEDVEILFGECPSVIVITISEEKLYEFIILAQKHDIHTQTIGKVTDDSKLTINNNISVSREEIGSAYFESLEKHLN